MGACNQNVKQSQNEDFIKVGPFNVQETVYVFFDWFKISLIILSGVVHKRHSSAKLLYASLYVFKIVLTSSIVYLTDVVDLFIAVDVVDTF